MKLAAAAVAGLCAAVSSVDAAQVFLRQGKGAVTTSTADDPSEETPQNDDVQSSSFDNLEAQVMSMAGHEGSSAGGMDDVSDLITKTLLPDMLNASEHAQKELGEIMAAFEQCVPAKLDLGDLKNVSDARAPKKLAHDQCRGKQQEAYEANEECDRELAALKNAKDAACNAVEAVKRDPADAANQCKPSPGMNYEDWLGVNENWFKQKNNEFKELVGACDEAKRNYDAKVPVCISKKTELDSKREVCNLDQSALEDSYCNVQSALLQACTDYTECHNAALELYNDRVPVIKAEEKARKVNWRVLKRITCLLPILKSGKKEEIEACRKKIHDTKHLDLKYQDPPEEAACDAAGPMPCEDDFKALAYGGLPQHAVAAECKACPGGAPPQFDAFKIGLATGKEVCIGGSVYEYTKEHDCPHQDLQHFDVPSMGQLGWRGAFDNCAQACSDRDDCSSFNYPNPGAGNCWIKYGRRKSESRGWNCGQAHGSWNFFTKIPGQKCVSPPANVAWSIPAGIQNNYPFASIPKSWKIQLNEPYSHRTKSADAMPKEGDCMLWGAMSSKDAGSFALVAFGKRDAVASAGRGKWENGAYWYYLQRYSCGFAESQSLSLGQADTFNGGSQKRLSWHTDLNAGGWRAGSARGLNGNKVWRKVVMYGPCEVVA